MKVNNIVKILIMVVISLFIIEIKAYAGSFSIRASETTAEPGTTITIYVTGNSAYGKINLTGTNIALSSNSVWVDENTQSVTGKIVGQDGEKATVTAVPEKDNLVDSNNPEEIIEGNQSTTISIKKKEVEQKPVEQPSNNPETSSQNKPQNNTQNNNNNSKPKNNQQSTTNKNNTSKINANTDRDKDAETPIQEDKEDQQTISEFGLTDLYLFGVKENGQKVEYTLTPNFDINVLEYTCNVESDILNVEIEKEANEYSELVKIEGIENPLKTGENIIKIVMDDNQGKVKQYIIKVIKEQEPKQEDEYKPNQKTLTFTIPQFISLQLGIIVLEIVIVVVYLRKKQQKI